jgi:hypothetical protein
MSLLASQGSNAKLAKNVAVSQEFESHILYLKPADSSDLGVNLCPAATAGCMAACLNTAGRGGMNSVQAGRQRKTELYVNDRPEFLRQLSAELSRLVKRAAKTGRMQAVRLNGTSDIAWERQPIVRDGVEYPGVPQAFPELQFYDYSKLPARAVLSIGQAWPKNYRLTFSRSESNGRIAAQLLVAGVNVAVVFDKESKPAADGLTVIDGDAHDMRFLDPKGGWIIALTAKGRAKKDCSGFVVRCNTQNVETMGLRLSIVA